MADVLTVALADDEAEVRDAYRTFFAKRRQFSLVGEAADGKAAVELFSTLRPDVTLMDLKMPIMSGTEAIRAICATDPRACVLALSTFGTDDYIAAALQAGAAGYLLKECGPEELTRSLYQARAGEMPLSAAIRRAVVKRLGGSSPTPPPPDNPLTRRETEVVGWLVHGLSNQEIAERMYLTEGSVKQYLSHVGDKLGVHARTQIMVAALKLRIVDLNTLTEARV